MFALLSRPIPLGKLWGIPINFTVGMIVMYAAIAALFTGNLWGESEGTLLFLLLFVVLSAVAGIHELAHALTARRAGLTVKEIRLDFMGAHTSVSGLQTGASRALVAFSGPLSNLIVAAGFLGANALFEPSSPLWERLVLWGFWANLALAIYNLLPAYPLDGGHIVEGLVWAASGDLGKARKVTVVLSNVVALALVAVGVLIAMNGRLTGVLIAIFLSSTIRQSANQVRMQPEIDRLNGRILEAVRPATMISERALLSDAIEMMVKRDVSTLVVASDDGTVVGVATAESVRGVPHDQRGDLTIEAFAQVVAPQAVARNVAARADVLFGVISQAPHSQFWVIFFEDRRIGVLDSAALSQVFRSHQR